MTASRLHLVRHGEVHNPARVLYGRLPDYHLSTAGREMAAAAADHVASLDRSVAALYASPLERAQESAEPFAARFDLVPEVDIRLIEPTNVFEGAQMRRSLMNPLNWWHLRQPSLPSWGEPYSSIAERMLGVMDEGKVVVRTLDAGSDKPLPFANAEQEENPALGVRGLRIARRNPGLLDDQLRALAAAAEQESADVEVMAPMVATVDEAAEFAARCRGAGLERVGIMIETPSAALLAAELFEVVDFVSLGTNDLAQYTMAADRLLSDLGDLNDPWQPAVLRLIGIVGAAGRAAGKHVGVCGEAGGDPTLAPVLVGLGATSLSMTPRSLGRVAAALDAVTEDDCVRAAEAARNAATAAEAHEAVREILAGSAGR